jgi:hypothetical protein
MMRQSDRQRARMLHQLEQAHFLVFCAETGEVEQYMSCARYMGAKQQLDPWSAIIEVDQQYDPNAVMIDPVTKRVLPKA